MKSLSAEPLLTTLVSPVTMDTPAALAASDMDAVMRESSSSGSPSSMMKAAERESGRAPLMARSLTVPWMASLPMSPPGKNSGVTTNESVVKAMRAPPRSSTAWSSSLRRNWLSKAGRKRSWTSWAVRRPPLPWPMTIVLRWAIGRGQFIDRDKKRRPVVPVRFVRACRAGHIGDIDWYAFAHNGPSDCLKQQRQLFIDERGTSGDLTEVWVRCECGKAERSMAQAALLQNRALGLCDGARPWLGPFTKETCGEPSRLLIRSASNAYFPQLMSVISLPERDEVVRRAVDAAWSFLDIVEDLDQLRYERRRAPVKAALEGISDEEVFAEIQARRGGGAKPDKSVKVAELETLVTAKEEVGEDRPEGVFHARSLQRSVWDRPWMVPLERIVLVHRLRKVVAQVGFTRFESAAPDIEGELDIGVRRASLAREITWLPAFENKGEGVFLQFKTAALQSSL